MGSSYRQCLNSGGMRDWEIKLRTACALIREVSDSVSDGIGDDGQYDNAADDGALREMLWLAIRFIEDELPKPKIASADAANTQASGTGVCPDCCGRGSFGLYDESICGKCNGTGKL